MHSFRVALGLTCLSLTACSPPEAKSVNNNANELSCALRFAAIECPGLALSFPSPRGTTALPELSRGLRTRVEQDGLRVLVLSIADDAEARTLLQVLLSAEQAGVGKVFVLLLEGSMEVATPDSSHLPPFAMSDLFVAVEGDGFSVSKSVAEFGSREASTALVDSSAVRGELLRNCPTDAACRVTALSASPVARFSEVRPILEALQAATSSNRIFRLVLDEGARSSTVSEFRKEEEISWAQGEVRAALESKQAELNACHGEGAQGVDALGGTLTVDFTITRLGIVFDAEVEPSRSTIVDPQIQSCVLELVTKIRFPRPAGTNSIVRHTFRF